MQDCRITATVPLVIIGAKATLILMTKIHNFLAQCNSQNTFPATLEGYSSDVTCAKHTSLLCDPTACQMLFPSQLFSASPLPWPCSSFLGLPQKAITLSPAVSASRKGGITAKSYSFQIKEVFGALSESIHFSYKEAQDCTRAQTTCFPPFME